MSRMSAASLTRRSMSALGHLAELEAEGEVVAHGHVRVQRVALEDHRDVAILGGHVVDHPVADAEFAGGDLLEPGDHPQAGGLAAAGRTDQDHVLAVRDLEVQVIDREHVAVLLRDVIEGNGCHRSTPCRSGYRGTMHPAAEADSDGPRTRSRAG